MTIEELQQEIIEEFSAFDDWMDKYQLLIDLGTEQEPLDEKYKTESNLIDGCQSRVWLQADYRDDRLWFAAESDALIVKGIIALLIRVFNGQTPHDILRALSKEPFVTENTLIIVESSLDTDFSYLEEIGLMLVREKDYRANRHLFIRRKV